MYETSDYNPILHHDDDSNDRLATSTSRQYDDRRFIQLVRWGLILIVIVMELGVVEWEAMSCSSKFQGVRVFLIADPQLTDQYSYRQEGLKLYLTQAVSDLFMRRHYRAILRWSKPTLAYFLGDLFDGGREWEEDMWLEEFGRFQGIFPPSSIKQKFIPGNHDIGVGSTIIDAAVKRYQSHFGELNYYHTIGEFTIVNIDGPSLAGNHSEVYDFINQAAQLPGKKLIFTHIPLYRPPNTGCLPVSGSRPRPKGIVEGSGYQYQNLLSPEQTQILLDTLQPIAVFSGDDHTTCWIHHQVGTSQISEYSIPTFSWLQGTPEPGYAFLDLPTTPSIDPTVHLCLFHSQLQLYLSYALLAIITIGLLGLHAFLSQVRFKTYLRWVARVALPAFGTFAALACWSLI